MTRQPISVLMTINVSPLLMQALPAQGQVREFLMDEGVWPIGALTERWTPDFSNPGSYVVQLEFSVPLPAGGRS